MDKEVQEWLTGIGKQLIKEVEFNVGSECWERRYICTKCHKQQFINELYLDRLSGQNFDYLCISCCIESEGGNAFSVVLNRLKQH
jgi:hypothetical protein